MEGQDYLNQIAAENRPMKKSRAGIFSSKIFLTIMIGVIALIAIIVVGAVLGSTKGSEEDLSYSLKLHLENTSEIIEKYQPSLKSSKLRASSISLSSILSNTERELDDYLDGDEDSKEEKEIKQNIVDEANLNKDALESDLFKAKINGNLDRVFAHKMSYDVSLIINEEVKLVNLTKNDTLKSLLTRSYNSLRNLYESFNSFSETN